MSALSKTFLTLTTIIALTGCTEEPVKKVEDQIKNAQTSIPVFHYTVQSGDTLSGILKKEVNSWKRTKDNDTVVGGMYESFIGESYEDGSFFISDKNHRINKTVNYFALVEAINQNENGAPINQDKIIEGQVLLLPDINFDGLVGGVKSSQCGNFNIDYSFNRETHTKSGPHFKFVSKIGELDITKQYQIQEQKYTNKMEARFSAHIKNRNK